MQDDNPFKNKKPNMQALLPFGFVKISGGYSYQTTIFEGQFKFIMTISDKEEVETELIELPINEKHWITICLDGSVPIEEIFSRIDFSYVLAKKINKQRVKLNLILLRKGIQHFNHRFP